jgi:YidC/Oxa1 family membrane protein insertase
MDRRFLLALVLSTLVVVVFYTYFIPSPKRTPPATVSADSSGADSGTVRAADAGRESTGVDPGQVIRDFAALPSTAPDTSFTIETPEVVARFSTRGGNLSSWRLKRFPGPDQENPVELVLQNEPSTVIDLGGNRIDLAGAVFDFDRQASAGGETIRFQAGLPGGVQVVKTYHVIAGSPLVEFDVQVSGIPASTAEPAIEVSWSGLPQAEAIGKTDEAAYGAVVSIGEEIERIPAGKFKKERERRFPGVIHWAGTRNKYFFAGVIPPEGAATDAIVRGDAAVHRAGAGVRVPLVSGAESRLAFRLYLGPLDYWKLKDVGFGLEQAVDMGWKIILPVSQALLWLLVQGYKIISNYGVVIIILSALTKIIFYPMTRSSMRSMQAMQKLQPEMERIRSQYKNDPNELNQQVMKLYKTHKVNPVGGCLPMLLQMPVFFALYTVLASSVELRHAGFMLWITDLSSPDVLFRIGEFELRVLPLLMAASMFWQQKLTPTDPRQAMLTYLMPVMMLFFFYGVPAGLTLYWTVTNLLGVAQQYLINHENKSGGTPLPAPVPERGGRKKMSPARAVAK